MFSEENSECFDFKRFLSEDGTDFKKNLGAIY